MSRDYFGYNRFLKPLCELITHHKPRKLVSWNESHTDFYYKCKVCGYPFFNNNPSEKDLEFIKEYEKNKENENE